MKIFAHIWYKNATTRDRLWTTIARQISDYTVVESVATTTTSILFTCTVSEIFTLNNGVHFKMDCKMSFCNKIHNVTVVLNVSASRDTIEEALFNSRQTLKL